MHPNLLDPSQAQTGDMPPPPAAHMAPLAEIARGATVQGLRFNLTTSSPQGGEDCIEMWVDEGQYHYPLAHNATGWGAVMSDVKSARVCIHRVIGATGQRVLLGQAEVRVGPWMPRYRKRNSIVWTNASPK